MSITNTNLESIIKQFALFRKIYMKACYKELKEYHFSPSEIDILLFLSNNPSINRAKDLSFCLGISKGLICRSVESLEKRELIFLEQSTKDKRVQYIKLSDKAGEVTDIVRSKQQNFADMILEGISAQEINIVIDTMHRINENIECVLEGDTDNESIK